MGLYSELKIIIVLWIFPFFVSETDFCVFGCVYLLFGRVSPGLAVLTGFTGSISFAPGCHRKSDTYTYLERTDLLESELNFGLGLLGVSFSLTKIDILRWRIFRGNR